MRTRRTTQHAHSSGTVHRVGRLARYTVAEQGASSARQPGYGECFNNMAAPSPSTFGQALRRHRLIAGLTQEGLAERAGISARAVQDLERGVNLTPRAETVRLLSEALGLDATARAGLIAAAHPELGSAAPLGGTLPAPPALPVPLTTLVGRDVEIATVADNVRGATATRMLTLTGPGGVGKTRLALAAAATLTEHFADGIFWVELAGLHDPALVPDQVAQALGIRDEAGRTTVDTVLSALAKRKALLVLDNLEHLLPAAESISRLLAGAPGLTILATSRSRLRVRGEREFPVLPLADAAAVRLFLTRATDAQPTFRPSSHDVEAVAEICQRLDGLPLAIELAAAWVRVLPPSALAARLERRLPLLAGGPLDAPERQRTMRAAIAWSHDLLAPAEQRFFRRLAVFAGGFTLDAAEAIAHDSDQHHLVPEPLDLLAALRDASLVQPLEPSGAEARFMLLETVREYGLEQLATASEAERVQRSHALYYLNLAERAEPELTGPGQIDWLERLEREHANLRAARNWSLAADVPDIALRLVGALWHFWQVRGHVAEGREWAEAALAHAGTAPSATLGRALRASALLAEYQGDYDHAVARHQAAAEVWRALGDDRNLARTLDHLGNCAHDRGDFPLAIALHEQALSLARTTGDTRAIANALGNLGITGIHLGDLETARLRLEEALHLFRKLDHAHAIGLALAHLGVVALRQGNLPAAIAFDEEALALARVLHDDDEEASALVNLSDAVAQSGDTQRAIVLLEQSRLLFARLGNRRATAQTLERLGALATAPDDLPRAAALLSEGLTLAREVDDNLTIAASLEGIASLATRRAQPALAACLLGAAAALRSALGAPVAAHLQTRYNANLAAARAALSEQAFTTAWEHGRTRPLEESLRAGLEFANTLV
ncbi:MAG: hypothetical protein DCC58_05820 [Chloroflexi bacterium]|nr:MAG: hypothetical protein DCC58_05820 [Chloroflexota bacterium]